MTEYLIEPNTRRCAITGRELQVGDRFYTALREANGAFVRQDYSGEAWQGPPPGTFSFWSGKVPPPDVARKPRVDDDLLHECFDRLEGQMEPSRVSFRYVVALLLMRRKQLKFEEAATRDGQEVLTLKCIRTGLKHEVVNPGLSEADMNVVQDEVFKVLGWR